MNRLRRKRRRSYRLLTTKFQQKILMSAVWVETPAMARQ